MQMIRMLICLILPVGFSVHSAAQEGGPSEGCLTCHAGLETIREEGSQMLARIRALGRAAGDPQGCTICHGGDPRATKKEQAHGGGNFYPDPGSPWVNEKTCGRCHPRHVAVQWNSLMMTEAGKIQGVAWAFGGLTGYRHEWGNYDAHNPADPGARLGTDRYRSYMARLSAREPGVFPASLKAVPAAPADLSTLAAHPEQAAFTYLRNQCQRCHLAVQGRQKRGDFRAMGCSACHIPYGNEGLYEGGDVNVPGAEAGHSLVHTIQASREARVEANGEIWHGIPVETCTTCHDRGKRIGVSFQGLMESGYTSPYASGGKGQVALHTKHYIAMQEDIHYQKGMICQDCHTSLEVHGDGFLACANLAQVEIECADCHGTTRLYPWELPLGFQDEIEALAPGAPARGVARELFEPLEQGTVYPVEDGYLLSARGNPFPEVVRRGDEVVVHTAAGKDLILQPLKLKEQRDELALDARVAMHQVERHLARMECYSCHASWAPQCYGCHVKVDYSAGNTSFDWVAAGQLHARPEHAADPGEKGYATALAGRVEEQRSYLRWEDPALGLNGENRISPVMPGCQVSVTIVGAGGEDIVRNKIFRTPAGTEGGGEQGQLSIDMSPAQPHTIGRARTCESCHLDPKARGYGIAAGRLMRPWNEPTTVDLMSATGTVLTRNARTQIEPIAGLEADWSRFVTEDGRQLQTVGHHFSASRPLDNAERAHMGREGVCLSCHQELPTESLAASLLHHVAGAAGLLPESAAEHSALLHKTLLISAWAQAAGLAAALLALLAGALLWRRRRRRLRAG